MRTNHESIWVAAPLRALLLTALGGAPICALAQQAAATSGGPETSATLEEVTITAERREETLQKSSLAIDVLSADALQKAGISQFTDIASATAGVQISTGGAQPQVYIRGVGDYGATSVSNPAVAFNLDGVYIARGQAAAGNFFDLARMEILKGPQGTLYGRNASGGAINLVPIEPKLEDFSGTVQLGLQNYNGTSAEAAVNLPLGSVLAARLAVQQVQRDGYLSDGASDDVHQSYRLQLLFKPSERFDARLWNSYSHIGGVGNGYAVYDPTHAFGSITSGLDPWTSVTGTAGNALIDVANAGLTAQRGPSPTGSWVDRYSASNQYQDMKFYNGHAEINWHMDWATLTLIPAYQSAELRYWSIPVINYAATDNLRNPETSYARSLEARLGNSSDTLKWVIGGFYYNEDQHSRSLINNGFAQRLMILGKQSTESVAAFGQTTYSFGSALRAIAGLRYTHEKKAASYDRYHLAPDVLCFFGGAPNTPTVCRTDTVGGKVTDSAVNYRVGLEYDLAADHMLFATVATGFKAGGLAQAQYPAFRPEKLTAFTLGSRNRFFDGSLQVNLEAFNYKYKDHQEFAVGIDGTGLPSALTLNAGDATSYGGNVDVVWAPTHADQVHLASEYVRGKYDSFVYTQPTATIPPNSVGCPNAVDLSLGVANIGTVTNPVITPFTRIDCSGNQLIHTPQWAGLAGYTHSFQLGDGGTIDATASMTYASAVRLATNFVPNTRAPGYSLWNATLTYNAPQGAWQLEGFVRNITNKAVYTGASQNTWLGGFIGASVGPPRTFGVRLSVNF